MPQPGITDRIRLEELLYAAGCEGLWDHILDDYDDSNWSDVAAAAVVFESVSEKSVPALLTAYFPKSDPSQLAELALQLVALGLVSGQPQIENVKNEDWLENWRLNFTITELTDKTLVVPTWQELPQSENRFGLRIYPGQGFGTGTHETTRLAAEFLEKDLARIEKPAAAVLDVGTGSGILAILAAKRGAARVLALDVDEDALKNARENCAHNQVVEQIVLSRMPVADVDEQFDVVVANIIVPVLRQLAPGFPALLKTGGHLILSGILREQLPGLEGIYSELGFEVKERAISGAWAACLCKLC
jgi:ribosomal protein L11 methyltransferase